MLFESDLSPDDRRHVCNALACGMLDGWSPSRESVALLIDVVAGSITFDEYKARVIDSATARSRTFGQLGGIAVPRDFDNPLPGAELHSWEDDLSEQPTQVGHRLYVTVTN